MGKGRSLSIYINAVYVYPSCVFQGFIYGVAVATIPWTYFYTFIQYCLYFIFLFKSLCLYETMIVVSQSTIVEEINRFHK